MNTIYCMDNVAGLRQYVGDACIDLTVTSPPYGNLRDYNGFGWDFEALAKELYRVTKSGGVVVWVVGDQVVDGSESGESFRQALYFKEIGFSLHDTMIYEKSNFSFPSANRYHQIFEYMFVLSRGVPKTYNPIIDRVNKYVGQSPHGKLRMADGSFKKIASSKKVMESGVQPLGLRHNIWRYNTGRGHSAKDVIAYNHPAIFPEKLVHDHIVSWSNPGDVVLDPFMGSGTTAFVAKRLGRNYLGFEIAEEYVSIANARLAQGVLE